MMPTGEIGEFVLDGDNVEIVRGFDSRIEDSCSCKGDILRRLILGRAAMTVLSKI